MRFFFGELPKILGSEWLGIEKKTLILCNDMAQFNRYDSLIDLSIIKNYCREKGSLCLYAKEESFVQHAEVGKYLGVVESGYFKYAVITSSGNEAVVGFAFEGEIVSDFYNSYNQ